MTDIAFKAIAFIILTPLLGMLFRTLLAFSGNTVVSDFDILMFLIGPAGWFCALLVAALWLGIMALEQSALLGIIAAKKAGFELSCVGSLRFAAFQAWPIIGVTLRIVALTLLVVAPFLAIAAMTYWALLTEYDINYYLSEKPPIFLAALGSGILILLVLTGILLRLFTGWFLALPILLFENVKPGGALTESVNRSRGHRRKLLAWIAGWAVVMVLLSAAATGLVGLAGRLLTVGSTDSLRWLAVSVGITLIFMGIANLIVNLLFTTSFATILFGLYQSVKSESGEASPQLDMLSDVRLAEEEDHTKFRLTTRRLLFACTVGTVIAVAVGTAAVLTIELEDDVEVMAHRGSSDIAPENTMAAFREAIRADADWIELDVQETSEGEVVVQHDSDLMKLAGRDLKIWNASLDDLRDIDIGTWFSPNFQDERIPTLASVLDLCKGRIGVNIELKYYGHDQQLERRVAEIVESRQMESDVMVMSLKLAAVEKMKSIRPDWKVGLLLSVAAGKLEKIDVDFLAINAGFANRRMIRAAHNSGKEVFVWTVNDVATMSSMISRGVDGLLTDKPALARSVLRQRAMMSPPERLLLEFGWILGNTPEITHQ